MRAPADEPAPGARSARPAGRVPGHASSVPAPALVALLAVPLLAACGAEDRAGAGAAVTDSAGVAIVQMAAPPAVEWVLDAEPELEIATGAAEEAEPLHQVAGVVELAGRIYVANGGSRQVLVHDAEGRRTGSFGRRGDGPGELRTLSALLALPGDSLLTWDSGLRRFQVYDEHGRYARSFSLALPGGAEAPAGIVPLAVTEDGALLVRGLRFGETRGPGVQRETFELLRVARDGRVEAVLATAPAWQAFTAEGGQLGNVPIPFGHSSHFAVAGERIVAALSDHNELRVWSGDGALQRILRGVAPAGGRVERREVDAIVASGVERAPGGMRQQLAVAYADMPIPEVKPPFSFLYAGSDGTLWLRTPHGTDGAHRMLVLDADGGMEGWLTLPASFEPLAITRERVVGVWRDDLGVESVRGYGVRRRE
jgi:hypothetical protein